MMKKIYIAVILSLLSVLFSLTAGAQDITLGVESSSSFLWLIQEQNEKRDTPARKPGRGLGRGQRFFIQAGQTWFYLRGQRVQPFISHEVSA